MIEPSAMSSRIKASELCPGAQLPATVSVWAEASHWACDTLNRIATVANPESKSQYHGMWHGSPSGSTSTFSQAWLLQGKKENKAQEKVQGCWYLCLAFNYPRHSVRVLTRHRTVLLTRNITWQRVLPAPPLPAQTNDSLSTE